MNSMRAIAFLFGRFFSPLLILVLSLASPPAYALRPVNAGTEESPTGEEIRRLLLSPEASHQRLASRAGVEELNPGHGKKVLKRLMNERRKLLDVLQRKNQKLTIQFVNLLHSHSISPKDVAGFPEAQFLTFELPSPAVGAFMRDKPTVIRENPFWVSLLKGAQGLQKQGGVSGGVYGVDVSSARSIMRRLTYAYTELDFDGGKPRRKVQLTGQPTAPTSVGLPEGTAIPEEAVLARLTPTQRSEFSENQILWIHGGEMNPFSEDNSILQEDMILYRPPHPSLKGLMEQLEAKYGEALVQGGIPRPQVRSFLIENYFFPIFILLRDQMQLQMMFRRLQTALKKGVAPDRQELVSLHLGGAMHFQSLHALISRDLPEQAPIRIESQDDPRISFLQGSIKGSSFFVQRFEEILNQIRIEKGDLEVNVPYFTDLFGKFLKEEFKTVAAQALFLNLFPGAAETPEAQTSGDIPFEALRYGIFLHGIFSVLTAEDLGQVYHQAASAPKEADRLQGVLLAIGERLSRTEYDTTPGMEVARRHFKDIKFMAESDEILKKNGELAAIKKFREELEVDPGFSMAWAALGYRLLERDDLAGAAQALEKATQLDPESVEAWSALARVRSKQDDLEGALKIRKHLTEITPRNANAWIDLGTTFLVQGNLAMAADAYNRIDIPEFTYSKFRELKHYSMNAAKAEDALAEFDAKPKGNRAPLVENAVDYLTRLSSRLEDYKDPLKVSATIAVMRRALKIDPRRAELWLRLGFYYDHGTKDLQAALDAYQQATAIDPKYVEGWEGVSDVLKKQRKFEEAIEIYRKLAQLKPDAASFYQGEIQAVEAELKKQEPAAGMEERAAETLATLARTIKERAGVLVIEAGALGELDWLEGLLAQPAFARRVVLFGTGSFEAHELAARHPGQVRFVATDEVDDLVVELLSMPSPAVSQVSYLGRAEPFKQLKRLITPWGLTVGFLEPGAELRLVLLALGVPAKTLDRIDLRRLEGQLARERAA